MTASTSRMPIARIDRFLIRRMLSLIGFFIWLAENISTFFGSWRYPSQMGAWALATLHVAE